MSAVKNAKIAPAQIKPEPSNEVANPKLYRYYRVKKLSGFLSELQCVEIDESRVTPIRLGKQDDRGIVLDKLRGTADDDAKAYFTADTAAKNKAAAGK